MASDAAGALRLRADHYRRLSADLNDEVMSIRIDALAEELEAQAARLEDAEAETKGGVRQRRGRLPAV
jgi:hypothetical protein